MIIDLVRSLSGISSSLHIQAKVSLREPLHLARRDAITSFTRLSGRMMMPRMVIDGAVVVCVYDMFIDMHKLDKDDMTIHIYTQRITYHRHHDLFAQY